MRPKRRFKHLLAVGVVCFVGVLGILSWTRTHRLLSRASAHRDSQRRQDPSAQPTPGFTRVRSVEAASLQLRGRLLGSHGQPIHGRVIRVYRARDTQLQLAPCHWVDICHAMRSRGPRPEMMGIGENMYTWYGYDVDDNVKAFLELTRALARQDLVARLQTDQDGRFQATLAVSNHMHYVYVEEGDLEGGLFFPDEVVLLQVDFQDKLIYELGDIRLRRGVSEPLGEYEAHVFDPTGTPLSNYTVLIGIGPWETIDGYAALGPLVEYDGNRFRVRGLPAGGHAVVIVTDNYAPAVVQAIPKSPGSGPTALHVQKGIDVYGVVRCRSGKPVAGATVTIGFAGRDFRTTTTSESGSFQLHNMGQDLRYFIRFEHTDYTTETRTLSENGTVGSAYLDVVLSPKH